MESQFTGYIEDSNLQENAQRWLDPATHLPSATPGVFLAPADGAFLIYQLPETKRWHYFSLTSPTGSGSAWSCTETVWQVDDLPAPGSALAEYTTRGVLGAAGPRSRDGSITDAGLLPIHHSPKYAVIALSDCVNTQTPIEIQVFSKNEFDRRLDNETSGH